MPQKMDLTGNSNHQQVSVDELKDQVKRYADERIKHLGQHIGHDSRQAWLDRSLVENFFKSNPEATGVRIYFGVTDVKHDDYKGGVHNLIFVPTRDDAQIHMDMVGDNDSIISLEHFSDPAQPLQVMAHICPPPPPNPCNSGSILMA